MNTIRLTLGAYHDLANRLSRSAAVAAFGVSEDYLNEGFRRKVDIRITCTAEQFGNFIAMRCLNGVDVNQVKNLNLELIRDSKLAPSPPCFNPEVDVRTKGC